MSWLHLPGIFLLLPFGLTCQPQLPTHSPNGLGQAPLASCFFSCYLCLEHFDVFLTYVTVTHALKFGLGIIPFERPSLTPPGWVRVLS